MYSEHPTPNTDITELLERFPHLKVIRETWGSVPCRKLLNELLSDTRDGHRQGFPPEAAKTIFSLLMEHDERFPGMIPQNEHMGFAASGRQSR